MSGSNVLCVYSDHALLNMINTLSSCLAALGPTVAEGQREIKFTDGLPYILISTSSVPEQIRVVAVAPPP